MPENEHACYEDEGSLRRKGRAAKPSQEGSECSGAAHQGDDPPVDPPLTDVPESSHESAQGTYQYVCSRGDVGRHPQEK